MENNYIIEDITPFEPQHFEELGEIEDVTTVIDNIDTTFSIDDILNSLLVRNDSQTETVQEFSVHTLDDLYNLNFCILVVLVVMLLLKVFHGIIRNIMRL